MAACETIAPVSLDHWSDVFADLYDRIARGFARTEVRERLQRYLLGLLDKVERKNGWQLAGPIHCPEPQLSGGSAGTHRRRTSPLLTRTSG